MVDSYENLEGKIWLDGELVEWKDAKFHLLTHALHYGSSVFEGERAYGGKIYKSYEHSVRLRKSAEYVDMEVPYSAEELEAETVDQINPTEVAEDSETFEAEGGKMKWTDAVSKARKELGITGFSPVKKGTPLYKRAKQLSA